MSLAAPNSIESQEFLFKALCRLRVFPSQAENFKSSVSLVASAPKYGFIFVGVPRGFQILQSNKIAELALSSRSESTEYPRREINLNATPSHFSVSCDQSLLVVGFIQDGCANAYVYDITKFCSKTIHTVTSIRLATTPGCTILDLHFNPGIPNIMASCTSDGGVGVYELKGSGIDVNTLPPATQALCLCWSPKGKQLVIGDKKGTLTQYKPDLNKVKSYPPPPDKQLWSVINVLWVSNYQFIAVYSDLMHPEERPCIIVVNVPKGGASSYVNYEDICYSMGELRPPQYYLLLQATWNVMMVASANGIEVGVLALMQDQLSWLQWTQEDAARAELPLTHQHQETYPIGMALDTSSTRQLPWGENQSLQPMPLLHILSHEGVLCMYHVINLHPGAAGICSPPQPLSDVTGLDQFTFGHTQTVEPIQPVQPQPQPQPQSAPQSLVSTPSASTSFQQQTFTSPTYNTTPTYFPTSASAPNASLPVSSIPPFSFSGVPAGSGDTTAQKSTGIVLPSGASVAFQPSQPTTPSTPPSFNPAGDRSPILHVTSAPKPLPPLVPVPPVPVLEPSTPYQEALRQDEPIKGAGKISDDKEDTVDPGVYIDLIQGEIRDFENDLVKLRIRVSQGFVEIGANHEKEMLIHKANTLEHFVQELQETTKGQTSEITGLQALVIESYSWVEDAKSRHQQRNDPSYLQLVRAQELDLASRLRMSNIQQLQFYVENQLHEVDKHLDGQWGEVQGSMQDVRNRLYIPTIEEIYQTMVKQNKILAKQHCILEDISQRIASRKLRSSNRIPLISNSAFICRSTSGRIQMQSKESAANRNLKSEMDLSSLAENLLEIKLRSRRSENTTVSSVTDMAKNLNISRSQYELASQKRLSCKKENVLRECIMQRPMVHIKPDRSPSEMRIIGDRPSISFSSAVLPITSRKSKKINEVKTSPAVKSTAILNTVQHGSQSSVAPDAFQFGKAGLGPDSNSSIFAAQKPTFPNSSLPAAIMSIQNASGRPQFTSDSSSGKNSTVPTSSKPATSSEALKISSVQTPSNSVLSQKQVVPKTATSASSAQSASTTSNTVKAKTVSKPMPSSNPPLLTIASKPELVKPVSQTPLKGDQINISKVSLAPGISFQGSGISPSMVTSTPKNSDKSPFGTLSIPKLTKADSHPPSSKEASGSPLASLGNLVDNLSAAPAQPKPGQEAAPVTAAKATPFSFQGSSPFAPTSTPMATSTLFGSGFGVPSSKPGLLPTPSKASTPAAIGQALNIGSVTITPVTLTPVPPPGTGSAASTASTFGAVTSTTTPLEGGSSLFGGMGLGGSPVSTNKSPASIFGGTGSGTLFSTPAASPTGLVISSVTGAASTAKPPLGTPSTVATSFSFTSAFGVSTALGTGALSGTSTTSTLVTPVFGQVSSSAAPPPFASAPSAAPALGQGLTTSATSQASAAAATAPSPAFGQGISTPAATPASVFGQALTTSSAAATPATAAASSTPSAVFSPGLAATTTPSAVVGQGAPAATTSTPSAALGQGAPAAAAAAVSTPSAVFGQAAPAAPAASTPSAVFGQGAPAAPDAAPAAAVSSPSAVFGQRAPAASTPSTVFGQGQVPVTSSVAGAEAAAVVSTPTSVFGQPQSFAPSSTSAPLFGTAPSSAAASTFSFAVPPSSAATTTSSASSTFTFALPTSAVGDAASTTKSFSFASPTATTAAPQPVFGSPVFGQPATSTPSTFFGQQICSPSSTGQSTSIFGGSSSVASTGFSQPATTASSIFAQTPSIGAFGQKSTFGQSGGSLFGSSTGSFTASGTSMFGGGQSGSSTVFGGGSTSSPSTNPFQQTSGGGVFGSSSPSTGSFSSGVGGTIGQSGFGSPPAFQQQSQFGGFGSAPAFGSSPAFGSPPAFGASPTFGGAPAFGSPSKVFGSSPPGFGAAPAASASNTFEALATQESGMTFGNLAQSTQQSPQSPNVFGGAASPQFGNTGSSFGGKSFSSWR